MKDLLKEIAWLVIAIAFFIGVGVLSYFTPMALMYFERQT